MNQQDLEKEWDAEKGNIKGVVKKALDEIKEHCDSVQIIVTRHNSDLSLDMSYEKGSGPIYSRIGAVSEWLEIQRQYVKNWTIRNDNEDE